MLPLATVGAVGFVLFFVPSISFFQTKTTTTATIFFSLPLLGFWFVAWFLDAQSTMKLWTYIGTHEVNLLIRRLGRIMPDRPGIVFTIHASFSIAVSMGLQALITHKLFDLFLMSCILAIFGTLHIDAFCNNRTFASNKYKN